MNLSLVDFGTSVAFQESTATGPTQYYGAPVINLFQAVHAAVRLDLGYALPNNLFTNTSAVVSANATIIPETTFLRDGTEAYQAQGTLYQALVGNDLVLPVDGSKRSTLEVPFVCSSDVRKSPGEIFVSVFVATVTMLGTGWTLISMIATYFATHDESEGE